MIVVADTSPLVVLFNIGLVQVLPDLFGKVIVPERVLDELLKIKKYPAVSAYYAQVPGWLEVRKATNILTIPALDAGEVAAISLALELGSDLLLIDERKGYGEAIARNLAAIGTVRVLERAAESGMIDLRSAFDGLKRSDFWISHKLLDEQLAAFLKKRGTT